MSSHWTFAKASRSRPLPLKSMINGWVRWELTKITAAGNLKETSRRTILLPVLDSCAEIPTGAIKKIYLKLCVEPSRGRIERQ